MLILGPLSFCRVVTRISSNISTHDWFPAIRDVPGEMNNYNSTTRFAHGGYWLSGPLHLAAGCSIYRQYTYKWLLIRSHVANCCRQGRHVLRPVTDGVTSTSPHTCTHGDCDAPHLFACKGTQSAATCSTTRFYIGYTTVALTRVELRC